MGDAKRDANQITTIIAVSSVDGVTPVTLYADPITHRLLVDAGSGTVGPGTINQIAFFDTTTSIASLSVATYPSLVELAYVKGVTSAIQTQLNGKQASLGFTAEDVANKVTSISGASTDTQYGSAKLLFDQLALKADLAGSVAQSFGASTLELGHATDTTIARSSAGRATVEGQAVALEGYTTIATAAGTTTLTVASTRQQFFTGTTTQTVTLPVTSTLVLGQTFLVRNLSTGIVTVNSSGANVVLAIPSLTTAIFTCILTSGTTAASWSVSSYLNTPSAGGGGMSLLASGTFSAATNATFTAAVDDVITSNAHGLVAGDKVTLTTTGTLPAGLSLTTGYFVRDVTTNTFKLSSFPHNPTVIDITDTGTGTHTWTNVKGSINLTFAAKKYLKIIINTRALSGGGELKMNFNADGTAIYAMNKSSNGAAAIAFNSSTFFDGMTVNDSGTHLVTMEMENEASYPKMGTGLGQRAAAGTTIAETLTLGFKYNNTSTQITSLTLFVGGIIQMGTGAVVYVYGSD